MPDAQASREGRCPRCGQGAAVPPVPVPDGEGAKPGGRALDAALFDIPHKGGTSNEAPSPPRSPDGPAHDLQEPIEQATTEGTEPAGGSKLPWFIDVFLYPSKIQPVLGLSLANQCAFKKCNMSGFKIITWSTPVLSLTEST